MERLMYADMAKKLLGDELYLKLLTEISKENSLDDLINYGKEVIDKCCLIIIMFSMSNKIKMDTVKLCLGERIIQISCKEFSNKYLKYIKEIQESSIK